MNNIKKLFCATTLLLLLSATSAAQDCQRHKEPDGGFSLCTPDGWTLESRENQKYKLIFAPRGPNFTPNINFKDEANTAPLADYVTASVNNILENYQTMGASSVKVVARNGFITTSGVMGFRVILNTEFKGLTIRTLQHYFIMKNRQKLIVTSTALEEDKAKLDPVFERALMSFRFDYE